MIKAILATSLDSRVGSSHTKSGLPWEHGTYLEDMKVFREKTLGNIVVMGRKTFDTLRNQRGLPKRKNLILTSKIPNYCRHGFLNIYADKWYCRAVTEDYLKSILLDAKYLSFDEDLWIIGGVSIYKQLAPQIEEFHITRISDSYPDADVEFNVDELLDEHGFTLVESTPLSDKCTVEVWRK